MRGSEIGGIEVAWIEKGGIEIAGIEVTGTEIAGTEVTGIEIARVEVTGIKIAGIKTAGMGVTENAHAMEGLFKGMRDAGRNICLFAIFHLNFNACSLLKMIFCKFAAYSTVSAAVTIEKQVENQKTMNVYLAKNTCDCGAAYQRPGPWSAGFAALINIHDKALSR